MTQIHEIAPNVFRISVFVPQFGFTLNLFLVRDNEPLLYHTGPKALFSEFSKAAASLIELKDLRWISYSHYESDECGALNDWLAVAPQAVAVTGFISASVNGDFAARPIRPLSDNETFSTGKKTFRYIRTPHLPHGWDAGLLFEETGRVLFTSDLFHQNGEVEAITEESIVPQTKDLLSSQGPFSHYIPYSSHTTQLLERLAELNPQVLAVMHGSSFKGNGKKVIDEFHTLLREQATGNN